MSSYIVKIHTYPQTLLMVPSYCVNESGIFRPSAILKERIERMSQKRIPRLVGSVTEQMAMEIIRGGKITMDNETWNLQCDKLQILTHQMGWIWKPCYGIYCDDIATIASNTGHALLFITECKGSTCQYGISRNTEAKMFYQLARTYEKMKRTRIADNHLELGGVISVVINHYSEIVTMNVNDRTSSFSGGLPDSWMYRQKARKSF